MISTKILIQAATSEVPEKTVLQLVELAGLAHSIDTLVDNAGRVGWKESEEWETIFHSIFGGAIGRQANRLLAELGTTVDWEDPNGTCGQDVLAWVRGFRAAVKPILDEFTGNAGPDLALLAAEVEAISARADRGGTPSALVQFHLTKAARLMRLLAGQP
jgi:hypothetical protein